jgi:hypothetical protein
VQVREAEAHDEHRQIQPRDVVQVDRVVVTDAVVDRFLGEVGAGEADDRIGEHDNHGEHDLPAVRPQVAEQPAHEARS